MATSPFATQFAAKAARVNPGAPSNSKWNGVRDLFAEDLCLNTDQVYVASISKPGNVSVRFGQSEAARSADVLVGMHTDSASELEGTIEAVRRVIAAKGRVGVVGFLDAGGWSVVAVIGPHGDARATSVAAANPKAVLVSA